jgi:hypothetical protein
MVINLSFLDRIIASSAEENRSNYCRALKRRSLFIALYGTYTAMMNTLKALLKTKHQARQTEKHKDEFREVQSRKKQTTEEAAHTTKKAELSATPMDATGGRKEVATQNISPPPSILAIWT